MNNLYVAFSVVFPLFCMMALGYLLRAVGVFNHRFLKELNNLCFKVFLPLVLFINIYKSDFQAVLNGKLILFAVLSVVLAFAVIMCIVPAFEKDNRTRGVIVQGIFRSNYILFGIPIAASLYGEQNTSVTAVLIAFVIPVFNILSVLALSVFSNKKISVISILKNIAKNPLIISSAVSFLFVFSGLRLSCILETTVTDISKVATPLALIILGGSFHFESLMKYKKMLIFSVLGKLIILPCMFVTIAVFFGFRGMELTALFAMFASPTAVSTYTMAQSMNANDELAGQIVVVDSIFSVFTIFVGITILIQFSLI